MQAQALLSVQPIHPLFAHLPALALPQHPDLPIAVADPSLGNLPNALPQRALRILAAAIPLCCTSQPRHFTRTPFADLAPTAQVPYDRPARR